MRFSPVALAAYIVTSIYCTAHFGFSIAFCICLLILFVIYSAIKRRIDLVLLIMLLSVIAGSVSYTISSSELMHKSVRYIDKEVSVSGVTTSSAQESGSNYRYTFHIKALTADNITVKLNDTIMLTTPQKLSCGASITATGTLKDFNEQMNENGFDMAKYYKSQNIFARIYSEEISESTPLTVITPTIICGKFREWVDSFIYKYYYGDGAAVLSAVLTGNTHHFSDEFDAVLNRTAFKHLYHPAFLHILIISFLSGLLTGVVPNKARNIAVAVILLAYAMLNCAQLGFTRCLITAALMIFFRIKNGSAHYPDTIAWIVTAVALSMPTMVFNTGFILSVSAGVIMWAFLPYFIKRLAVMPKSVRKTAAAITVCTFIYTPVSLFFYNRVCIYTLIMPFITIPLVLIALTASPVVFTMLSLLGTAMPIKPYLDGAVLALLKLPEFIYKLPLSQIIIPSPTPSGKLLVICLLLLVYYHINNQKQRQYVFAALASGFIISLTCSAILKAGTTDFIFVNVGQGDGAVIHTAYKTTVLIDGGGGSGYSDYNPGETVYLPYLESKGYSDIDAAFITHFHSDHAQGIIAAIENLRVKNVFAPAPDADWDDEEFSLMEQTEAAARKNGTTVNYISENTELSFDGGLTVSVYAPDDVIVFSKDDNDSSLLIKAEYRNTSVLYTGDMTAYAENEYMRQGIDLSSDILKVAHHGSATSTTPEWVNAVNPEYAIISCGLDNVYGHPKPQTIENLKGIPVLRTDMQGDIKITAGKNGIKRITTLK